MPQQRIPRRLFLRNAAGVSLVAASCSPSAFGSARVADDARFPIACYTRPWAKFEYRVALDAIAEAGFKNVGLMSQSSGDKKWVISVDTPLEEAALVNEEVKKRGLKVLSVWAGSFNADKSLDEAIQGLRHQVDCCKAVECPSLLLGGIGQPQHHNTYYDAVKAVCDYAAEQGVRFDLKPHGGTNATGPQCRETIEKVGHSNLRMWYDPGNIFYYSHGKLNPVDDAPLVAQLVSGMCIKDFRMKDVKGKPTRDVKLTPGDGLVDFPKVLSRLIDGGFQGGPLIIECLTDGDLPFLLKEAKRAKQFSELLVAKYR